MSETTGISWTEHTMNFWWGCQKVSPGCDHCYAERLSERFGREFTTPWRTSKANWDKVRLWDYQAALTGKAIHVFVNSMSDFFDLRVPAEWREEAWSLMCRAKHLRWQVLTKRPGLMAHWALTHPWPDHIWAGTSVESAKYLPRLDVLARVPAKVRFVSCEPLLGPLDLRPWMGCTECHDNDARDTLCACGNLVDPTNGADPRDLDWVIIGGESGPDEVRREMRLEWLEDIVSQCQAAGVPVHVKQDSGRLPGLQGRIPDRLWALKEKP